MDLKTKPLPIMEDRGLSLSPMDLETEPLTSLKGVLISGFGIIFDGLRNANPSYDLVKLTTPEIYDFISQDHYDDN